MAYKKKWKKQPRSKMKCKAQPTSSAAREVDEVDDEGLGYSVVPLHDPMGFIGNEWCLNTQEAMQEDIGCAKAICSRSAYHQMRKGVSGNQIELLPDSSTLASHKPPLFTDLSIVDEGSLPFIISLSQMRRIWTHLSTYVELVKGLSSTKDSSRHKEYRFIVIVQVI